MESKKALIGKLRQDILQWEGYRAPLAGNHKPAGLGPLEAVFPNQVFPAGAIHEMICTNREQAAASAGLVAGILSVLMGEEGITVWISRASRLYAPAFAAFGVSPHRLIVISQHKDQEALWVMEEALKCSGLKAVVCELQEMDFKQSRRLQLAVEQSRVTGFVLRNSTKKIGATTCAARWQVRPVAGKAADAMPGLSFPRWEVELLKVRNGETGKWVLEWRNTHFVPVTEQFIPAERRAG